jgi:pyruvate dehydrogenase E1 component
MATQIPDHDPQETQEWLESLQSVLEKEGAQRAHFLLDQLINHARLAGDDMPISATTPYVNTIPVDKEERSSGNHELEHRIRALTRWNAMAIILNANKESSELGGHIASFASAATLYDIGFNHFFRGHTKDRGGDMVYFQGHCSPGIYARAFLEGRLSEDQLRKFRQEVDGGGLSSYPHPWLMPNFWQFPTVSMGLGPLMAIYQARFMRYLQHRNLAQTDGRKVWAFLGDGETDEPESLGAISMAGREGLDNLIFVINCNLQRLDGPVRGNGKIIQELEGVFRGAGWNVIKVVWGRWWDRLLAKDKSGLLAKRMMEVVDGEYQNYKAKDGAFVREHFFGKYPELLELVADMSDDEIWRLNRGGHDPFKVFAAYSAATKHKGQPTVILAKTVKGYGMGSSGEAQNPTHQQKKMDIGSLRNFRDRFNIPVSDEQLPNLPFVRPAPDSQEAKYLKERGAAMGNIPAREPLAHPLNIPTLDAFDALLKSSEDREFSTTMAFVRMLGILVKDKAIGRQIVPIVPDESRTFGMEGMFRQLGIFSQVGQLYTPQDADQLMFYKESASGQILQEGINEAGGMADWIAAATAYANHGVAMIPFYIYYSMFGFQRIGDLAYAAGDLRARGFLVGGTAGRTTLNGEGLQHQDGHSHLMAATIPNCVSYDPTFAYELAVIVQDGMRRMYQEQQDVFYYLTVMNENYTHPAMPKGAEQGIIKGMYKFSSTKAKSKAKVQLLGSGTILREVIAAAELLARDFDISSDVWSVTSFNELRRDGIDCERWNMLHPEAKPRASYVEQCLDAKTPVVAATDYMRAYPDQIRPYVKAEYKTLGTDGFGRSDFRRKLREFFEVDRYFVAVAALKALADEGSIEASVVSRAIKQYQIDADKPNPTTV